jgi:hypothetical protein
MREFFRHPLTAAAFVIVGIVMACVIFFKTCTHEVTYTGVVLSHNVTSDRAGNARYFTVARFEDGTIRSISGLKFYVVEVGATVHYTTNVINK